MRAADSDFSRAHQIEMKQLLDTERFALRQIQFAEQEIQRLTVRVSTAENIYNSVTKLKSKGATLTECIEYVAERFPYELDPQRSFKETLKKLPPSVTEWEIGLGSLLRAQTLFSPMVRELEEYLEMMRRLSYT
jgi:hypothetical protein